MQVMKYSYICLFCAKIYLCDVLIFPELIESVLVKVFVNQGILENVAFFHGFP